MSLGENLYRRGATYYWRRALPAALSRGASLPLGHDIRLSLRTHVLGVARQRARRLGATADVVLGLIADAMPDGSFAPAALHALVRGILAAELDRDEYARAQSGPRGPEEIAARTRQALDAAEALRRALAANDLVAVEAVLTRATAEQSNLPTPGTPDHAYLARQVLRGMVGVQMANAQREQGHYADEAPPAGAPPWTTATSIPVLAAPPVPAPPVRSSLLDQPLSAVVKLWIDELLGHSARAAIGAARPTHVDGTKARAICIEEERDIRTMARLFAELVGDTPVGAITQEHATDFKHRLACLPKLHGKSVYRDLSARAAIRKAESLQRQQLAAVESAIKAGTLDRDNADSARFAALVPRLAPKTVNKHLDTLGRLFKWLRNHKKLPIADVPTKGLRHTKSQLGRLPSDDRDAWEDEELRVLFATPNWTGCAGANHRHRLGSAVFQDSKYWVPLLEALMGLRLEEATQLCGADIKTYYGRLCVLVAPGDGHSVKSASSRRVVPVHPLLLRLGFEAFVERMKAAGKVRLFPDLSRNTRGRVGAKLSEWLTRYLRHVGLSEAGRANHSLRHSFSTHLHNRDIPDVRVSELVGHVRTGETKGRYIKGSKFAKLCEAIDAIDYGLHVEERDGGLRLVPAPADAGRDS